MKTLLLLLAAVSFAPDLTWREVADQVFVVTHAKPWPANSLVYRTAGGDVVLVGTPYTAEATAHLLDEIVRRWPGASVTAINGHFHEDASGGNPALIARDIPVYGSDLTAALLRERQRVPPNRTFPLTEPQRLRIGGERVEIHHPGAAHSPDNVVVWFPARGVLFGGCMVRVGGTLGNLSDADVASWPEAAARLRQFDAQVVIPGHGLSFSPSLIGETERAAREKRGR